MEPIVWQPSSAEIEQSQMFAFMQFVNQNHDVSLSNYKDLHSWSVNNPGDFWAAVWQWSDVIYDLPPQTNFVPGPRMQDSRWFSGATLNFAQNLLRRKDNNNALVFMSESGERSALTFHELNESVAIMTAYLRSIGLGVGDCVCAMVPNFHLTIVCMLATTSIGAIWSSCSPDFGAEGLLMRFSQIKPTVLFAVDSHHYNGKAFNHSAKIIQLQQALPSLKQTIILPYSQKYIATVDNSITYREIMKQCSEFAGAIDYAQMPFSHPTYILFSSGTTGVPKCMVHSAGGTLLQHLKEHRLHGNLRPDEKLFFYTTCGWMMWNWMVSGLAVGATLVLYDGSPFYPKHDRLYELVDEEKINVFGCGAKFFEACENENLLPNKKYELTSLRTILTTGSPLLDASFDYIAQHVKKGIQIGSISGGSDIVSCFVLNNPMLPVYRGEIQAPGLGMDMHVYNAKGESITNEKGELVCATPFPCMPVGFWNDPDGERYNSAYFEGYPGVWTHGDYALINDHMGVVIFGRSDTTLNPGGVRIGTAEIYKELEAIDSIAEAMAVGQKWQGDERIILIVTLTNSQQLTEELIQNIRKHIRQKLSPKHVPAVILQVPDLPRTANGKLVEIAAKKTINGDKVDNLSAIANPECLEYLTNRPELT